MLKSYKHEWKKFYSAKHLQTKVICTKVIDLFPYFSDTCDSQPGAAMVIKIKIIRKQKGK